MRGYAVRLVLVILILVGTPRFADAGLLSFWEWLDRLSGPGPWVGVVSEWNPFVLGAKQDGDAAKTFVFDPSNTAISPRDFYVRIGPQLGYMRALYNDLDYGGAKAPKANAFVFGATFDAGAKGIEAGLAAGWVHFYGDGFGVTKATVQPRITIYPLVAFTRNYADKRLEGLFFRVGANRIIGKMTAADFGAIDGDPPQPMGDEWLFSIVIGVNPFAFRN